MKITANYHKKVPVPGIEYGSQGFACEIEIEPPPEVREDRQKLREYVERLFAECKARVEDQIQAADATVPSGNGSSRPHGPPQPSRGHHRPFRSDRGMDRRDLARSGPNGQSPASPKQINFLRSIANEQGMGYEGLCELAREAFGKDVSELTRREASTLIDDLQGKGAS